MLVEQMFHEELLISYAKSTGSPHPLKSLHMLAYTPEGQLIQFVLKMNHLPGSIKNFLLQTKIPLTSYFVLMKFHILYCHLIVPKRGQARDMY